MFKRIITFILLLIMVAVPAVNLWASVPFSTYTFTYFGEPVGSPHAYVPTLVVELDLSEPGDMDICADGNVFIADAGNNRVLKLSYDFEIMGEIVYFTNPDGYEDSFNRPQGLFIHPDGRLFVADTSNRRIVVFDEEFNCIHIIGEPESPVLPPGFAFEPFKIAVDFADRVYVVALTTNQGVIEMTMDGEFRNFIGARRVHANVLSLFWRMVQTDEQRARDLQFVPTEFNNIAVDSRGFLYVTTNAIEWHLINYGQFSRTDDGQHMPIQRLSPSGSDTLVRNSFFPPSGDIFARHTLVSSIVDIALGDNGVYSVLCQLRGKIFTYDSEGALLYAFGGLGVQKGLSQRPVALVYRGTDILLLDGHTGRLTVFERTSYGYLLHEAIDAFAERRFTDSFELWGQVLQENNNLDIAYIGMGQALLFSGEYQEAMRYFRIGNNNYFYSMAFFFYRQEFISNNFLWLLPLIIAIFVLLRMASKAIKKVNNSEKWRHTLVGELCYSFHVIFHPFDGFYDIRHEKRGSLKAAMIILTLAGVVFVFQRYAQGFIFMDYRVEWLNPITLFLNLVVPVAMWCLANWCLTTLMDGEGGMKHIFTAAGYAVLPIVLMILPATIISNFITLDESFILTAFSVLAYGWMGILMFFGMLVTHNYTLPKNILACSLTVVGMAVLLFLGLLSVDVLGRILMFASNIYREMNFRIL